MLRIMLRIADPLQTFEKGLTNLQSEKNSDQSATLSSLKGPSEEVLAQLPLDSKVIAGFYRTPEEFFDKAKEALHPLDMDGALPDELVMAVKNVLELSPADFVKNPAFRAEPCGLCQIHTQLLNTREMIKISED